MILQKDEFTDLILNDCIKDFRKKYLKEYETIDEFIKLFRASEQELVTIGKTRQDLYVLSSLTELNELFQSAVLLLERGVKDSAYIIIRSILELIFRIIEVIRNEKFIDTLSLKQQYDNKKMLNDIKSNKLFDMVPEEDVIKYITKCEQEINGAEEPKFTVKELANKNGFNKAYILYRLQCDYTHQTNFIIENKIKITENGFVVDWNFKLDDFKTSIAWLISITSIIFPVILNEYIKNNTLKDLFNNFMKHFEFNFKDLIY